MEPFHRAPPSPPSPGHQGPGRRLPLPFFPFRRRGRTTEQDGSRLLLLLAFSVGRGVWVSGTALLPVCHGCNLQALLSPSGLLFSLLFLTSSAHQQPRGGARVTFYWGRGKERLAFEQEGQSTEEGLAPRCGVVATCISILALSPPSCEREPSWCPSSPFERRRSIR